MSWVKAVSQPEKSDRIEELIKHLVQAQQSLQQQHLQSQQSMQQAQQSIQQQHLQSQQSMQQQHQETTKLLLQQIQLQQKSQQQHQQEAQQQIQLLADAIQSRATTPTPGPTEDSYVRKAVSHTETECLKFKIHQNFEVGILQPATVTIYEYYALGNRCTKFYHPTEDEGELRKICKDAECHCISERCNLRNGHKQKLKSAERITLACQPGVDYVYDCKLDNIQQTGAYDIFTMAVTRVIKMGSDEIKDGDKRRFYIHKSCRDSVKVEVGRNYIIWGRSEDVWKMKNEMSYVINGGTWFELMPTNKECGTIEKDECEELEKFIDDLVLFGCQS